MTRECGKGLGKNLSGAVRRRPPEPVGTRGAAREGEGVRTAIPVSHARIDDGTSGKEDYDNNYDKDYERSGRIVPAFTSIPFVVVIVIRRPHGHPRTR